MYRRFAAAWLLTLCFTAAADAQIMSHSVNSTTIQAAASINCSNANGHADNSYWRSYTLCGFNIDDEIIVNSVSFGVENSTPGAAFTTQPINVRIYEDPTPGNISPVAGLNLLYTEQFQLGTIAQSIFTATFAAPVVVACHTTIVVEINSPNGQTDGHLFFIGANNLGQTGPSYISSAPCSITEPTNTASINFPDMQIIIDVNYSPGALCSSCSGIPVDCHAPSFGSYELLFEQSNAFSNSPASLISDTLPTTTDTITVTGVPSVSDVDLFLDITHPYVGDLNITLTDPMGTAITIHANAGVNLQNIRAIYDDAGRMNARPYSVPAPGVPERIMPSGPGALGNFVGGVGNGVWTLRITDGAIDPNVGTLNSWELRFVEPVQIPDGSVVGVDAVLPVKATNFDEIADVDLRTEIGHPAAGQLVVDLTSPAGTTVRLADQNFAGSGINERFDDAGPTYCDGFGFVPSGPGSMSDFDGQGVGGDWILNIRDNIPGSNGELQRFALMINPVPCDPPTALTCASNCSLSDVNLTWTNPATSTYSSIEILRDGVLVGTVGGTDIAFTDVGVPAGQYQYSVVGDCNPGKASVTCDVNHQVYAGATDIIFALEAPDLTDSAGALEGALTGLGLNVQVVDSFAFDCVMAPAVQRVWVMCGTFPQNYSLTAADGNALVSWNTNGIAVFLEGVDIWGFDAPTPFEDYDGVENASFMNIDDGLGDDSLVQLTGQNSGFGVDLSGIVVPYMQASPGAEETDRILPCDINADLGGASSGTIFTGLHPTDGPYNVAVHYASNFAPVISQSFEIGGYGGVLSDLVTTYVTAFGGVLGGQFKRGDMNADGSVNLQDPIQILGFLFNMGAAPVCPDSADANDDGSINLQDPVLILQFLFNFGLPPAAPGPNSCGPDVNADTLNPCNYPTTSPPC